MSHTADTSREYSVRAVRCDHLAPDAEVEEAVRRVTAPLARSWALLQAARRIAIKANIVWEPYRIPYVDGRRQELVDDAVLRGVLRVLRERTSAELLLVDSTYHPEGPDANVDVHFLPLLAEFGVEYVECTRRELAWYDVPGGGLMFNRYQLNPVFGSVDALVSVATLKTHAFMGVTLSTKNLFGLCPVHPCNRPRTYFHHLVRLPYVLADLGRLLRPTLCVVDGLVASTRREWGGDARVCDTLVAGDNCIATDSCAAHLMGHDPASDWPAPPFRRDRNHLQLAAGAGYGTVDLDRIDYGGELAAPVGQFDSEATDPPDVVASWRSTTCEQALSFRDRRAELTRQYAGEYLYMQGGEVVWHDTDRPSHVSRRQLAGPHKASALWLKYVDPDETEGESFETYERELACMHADPSTENRTYAL